MPNLHQKFQYTLSSILILISLSCVSQTAGNSNEMTNKKDCFIQDELNLNEIEIYSLPILDPPTLSNSTPPKDSPLRFADSVEVDLSPNKNGTWLLIDDATKSWRLRIVSPGSLSINIGFTTFKMPEGGCLFLFTPNREIVLGPYTNQDNYEHGQLWTPSIDGEEVIIEVTIPSASIAQLRLIIGSINREFRR